MKPDKQHWPTAAQELLLRAGLAPREEAQAAWTQWVRAYHLDDADLATRDLLPLVHYRLTGDGVEHPLFGKLGGIRRYTWCENQVALRILGELQQTLLGNGFDFIALSGAAFLQRYYPDPSLRPLRRLNLLLPPEYTWSAVQHLLSQGWRPKYTPPAPLSERHVLARPVFVMHGPDRQELQLHRQIFPFSRATNTDPGDLGDHLVLTTDAGPLHILDATRHLLHLCDQAEDGCSPPSALWAVDATLLLRSSDVVDWERLMALAADHQITLAVRECLHYLARLLAVPVPGAVFEELSRRRISRREIRLSHVRRTPPARRGLHTMLLRHWSLYQTWRTRASFVSYLQDYWGLRNPADVLTHVSSRVFQRIRRGPAPRSDAKS